MAKEIFPDMYQNIEDYPDKLKIVEDKLLEKISKISNSKTSVIIDLINLEKRFLKRIKKDFNSRLILKVLCPSMETTIERDKKRAGWTSGESAIKQFYKKYEELKPLIGEENYIDNSNLTPQKTLEMLITSIASVNEN